MQSYAVLDRKPRKGDEVVIMDEIVRVTGLETDRFGQVVQVLVDRQGETFSISPFETPIEVIERER